MTSTATGVLPAGFRLRKHQAAALEALRGRDRAGQRRAWVVLPPGAGKTLVGLVTASELLDAGVVSHVVVLTPNTAIQGQWHDQATRFGLASDIDRDLDTPLSVLTYQSLAVFDPDNEVGDDPQDEPSLIDALHVNGRRLLESLQRTEGLLLVLDECHHLLEVWGRLLAEILGSMPHARVLGLTATPPDTLTREQSDLVGHLFGDVAFSASIPAVVKEGDLVPFAELAWLVEPTPEEQDWLDQQAVRFTELTTDLTRPGFADVDFLDWLRTRFVDPVPATLAWAEVVLREPELADAALRMHHAGLLVLPTGARLTEQHRRPPTVEDWMALVEEWALGLDDPDLTDALRRALPSVGYVWTRAGVRRGRTPTDRVLARSEAKAGATVDLVTAEHAGLGERMRMLVLCDHERAGATVPATLVGVLDQQAGSARAVLAALLRDPGTRALAPLLVTGRTVAGSHATLAALRDEVRLTDSVAADSLRIVPLDSQGTGPTRFGATSDAAPGADDDAFRLDGRWSSRQWVGHVTRLLTGGGTQVLVGTRGLLGEGWDARCLTGLVDLTTATSLTAVVQTRGRALRTDPAWPDKVAVTWSVTCVSDRHPRGDNDWQRLVRKHTGFHGVDEDGTVADGVAHLDAAFSPYTPPPVAEFPAINARMAVRAERRSAIAEAWRVGEPYVDRTSVALRLRPRRRGRLPTTDAARELLVNHQGLVSATPEQEASPEAAAWHRGVTLAALITVAGLVLGVLGRTHVAAVVTGAALLGLALVPLVLGWRAAGLATGGRVRRRVEEAGRPPSLAEVARALADGLHRAELVARGAEAVAVETTRSGEHRILLGGVEEAESALFASALEELVSPIAAPRYVVSRYVTDASSVPERVRPTADAVRRAELRVRPSGEAWHAVPAVLGVNATRVDALLAGWRRWVGDGRALRTATPEGGGVLRAQVGSDPFEVSAVMRRQWE